MGYLHEANSIFHVGFSTPLKYSNWTTVFNHFLEACAEFHKLEKEIKKLPGFLTFKTDEHVLLMQKTGDQIANLRDLVNTVKQDPLKFHEFGISAVSGMFFEDSSEFGKKVMKVMDAFEKIMGEDSGLVKVKHIKKPSSSKI